MATPMNLTITLDFPVLLITLPFSLASFFCMFIQFFWGGGAESVAYGSSQVRGRIRAVAASLRHSHSKVGSELCLRPTSQLTAAMDPQRTEQGQGSNLHPHGY